MLRHLTHEVGAVRMQQVVRFTDPAEAQATLQVRQGDPGAVDFYLNQQRVLAGTDTTMPDLAYTRWLADVRAGRDSLLLASATQTVVELNSRARADRIAAGEVVVDGIALRDGTAAGVGDRVATRRNERRPGRQRRPGLGEERRQLARSIHPPRWVAVGGGALPPVRGHGVGFHAAGGSVAVVS